MERSTNATPFSSISLDDESTTASGFNDLFSSGLPRKPRRPTKEVSTQALPDAFAANWTRLSRSRLSDGLFQRLLRISSPSTRSTILKQESLHSFLEFWESIRDVAIEPEITLTREGYLHVEWFESSKRHLDVKFLGNQIIFGIFDNGSIFEGVSDKTTVTTFLKSQPSQPLRWKP